MGKNEVRPSRCFNGIVYRVHGTSRTEKEAYNEAKEIRKLDYLARVVTEKDRWGKLYIIYTRKKRC